MPKISFTREQMIKHLQRQADPFKSEVTLLRLEPATHASHPEEPGYCSCTGSEWREHSHIIASGERPTASPRIIDHVLRGQR